MWTEDFTSNDFKQRYTMEKVSYKFLQYDTVVVGSGAAAYNAVDWLYDLGRRNIALLTEGIRMGTSRNTGRLRSTV